MGVSKDPGRAFEAVTSRHRALVVAGMVVTFLGLGVAGYVGYEWFVVGVSHEVLAIVAAVALLVGIQVLILTSLTSMLILLHEELIHQVEE